MRLILGVGWCWLGVGRGLGFWRLGRKVRNNSNSNSNSNSHGNSYRVIFIVMDKGKIVMSVEADWTRISFYMNNKNSPAE